MFRTLKAPITVQIEVTEGCDNVCRHCYNFFRHQGYRNKTLTKEQADKIISEFKDLQVIRGVITGGEPLLAPDLVVHLANQMRALGMGIMFNSNLTLFNETIGKRMQESGIGSIMTSLIADDPAIHDFVTQQTGSWEKTTNNIKLAIKMGFRVMVNMVLTKWNYHRLQQTGDLVGSWGVKKFGATRACPPGPIAPQFTENLISIEELRSSLQTLYELQEKWGYRVDVFEHYPWCALGDVKKYHYLARRKCTAGVTSASIGASGQMRPCGHSSMTYGNVFEEGIQAPWLRMTEWRKQKYSSACQSCRHYRSCTGGCAVDAQNSERKLDHHMTCENDVSSLPGKELLPTIGDNDSYSFIPQAILRKEEFGGIIASGKVGAVYVDKQAFDILKAVRSRSHFTAKSISNEFQVEIESTRDILARLESQHLTKKGG